jgi:hypothetical protein
MEYPLRNELRGSEVTLDRPAATASREGGEMAGQRLSMRKAREILRQKWELNRSHREVAESVGVSKGAITGVMHRALSRGLASWEVIAGLSEEELEAQLYDSKKTLARAAPDCLWIHTSNEYNRKLALCGSVECGDQRCELDLFDVLHLVDEHGECSVYLGRCLSHYFQKRLQIALQVPVVGEAGLRGEVEAYLDVVIFDLECTNEARESS